MCIRDRFLILVALQTVADLLELCAEGEGVTQQDQQTLCDALRNATDALNAATTPFAGLRMNARVQQALSGQRIDQIAA